MAAKALKLDELKLDSEESKVLAGAIQNVASHYDYIPDAKVVAWVGLIGTVGAIYGPRIVAIKVRKATAKRGGKPEVEAQAEEQAGLAMVRPFEMSAR